MNPEHIKHCVEISSSLLTPIIGIVASIILILQYLLARRTWRLNLYDKRYPVYLETMSFIASVVRDGEVNKEELLKFLRNSRDKEFLFKKDTRIYLNDLYKKGLQLMRVQKKHESLPVGEELNKKANEESELLEWFSKQFDYAKELFGQYLTVDTK